MKRFLVITNLSKDPELIITRQIQNLLEINGAFVELSVSQKTNMEKSKKILELAEHADCIIVLGGDGTLLKVARDTIDLNIPLLGVNLGTLGYLAEVEVPGIEAAIHRLLKGEYDLEERMMITGSITRSNKVIYRENSLNDIIITRGCSLKVISYVVYVNGQLLSHYKADGIIISTPTGSTAYNLSAGGPIVEPQAQLLVLTPICPHTLNHRSIILSADDKIVIEIVEDREGKEQVVETNFDGESGTSLKTGDCMEITRSKKKTKIIKMNKVSFLATLHKKISE